MDVDGWYWWDILYIPVIVGQRQFLEIDSKFEI
jgi:hypothetical protein